MRLIQKKADNTFGLLSLVINSPIIVSLLTRDQIMDNNSREQINALNLNTLNKRKYENLLSLSLKDLSKEKTNLKILFENLNKEKHDVSQLEKLSFVSFYHTIIGGKTEKLNKEQQEYFTAKLKFDSCQNTIKNLKKDIQIYKNNLKDIDQIAQDGLTKLKNNHELSKEQNQYIDSIEKHTYLQAQKTEIQQAIKIGNQIKFEFKSALKHMKSAKNWGIGDLLGGGLITTAIKHSKIDTGKEKIEEIKNLIIKFKRELNDVNKLDPNSFEVNISSFNTFADFFVDGIIFDWMVQSKINKTIGNIEKTATETKNVVTQLYRKLDYTNKELQSLEHVLA
jgi:hypothetical protein